MILIRDKMVNRQVKRGDPCQMLTDIAREHPELWGPPADSPTPTEAVTRAGTACAGWAHVRHSGLLGPARYLGGSPGALMRFASMTQSDLSPEAQALYADITVLGDNYQDPTTYDNGLSAVLDTADVLPDTAETTIIDATASVAQSSQEYWMDPSNEVDEESSFADSYGDCSSDPDPMYDCLGMSADPYVASNRTPRDHGSRAKLVSLTGMFCPGVNWTDILHMDVGGAFGGAELGGPIGAAAGAGAASASESWWQLGVHLWCIYAD